ncbi:hypothetical protein HTZ84_13520 [Haloterrigena sp. SYSU A558-1]|uniref:Uncharacterized protein n=1 Tax=Haloterrigena gelatinilytica TaxID=2741724 RepID=A0ABX2LD39_9EURY|nr:hypothetical protein [Haloterrigena gelatinilytica]NUC73318.1 hypothetical protein [Haloterrigena gelatinilytica]
MSEDDLLSRRQSLLGIGAVGTALGGSALGVSGVFDGDETDGKKTDGKKRAAGDDKKDDDRDDEAATKAGLDLEVVCHESGEAAVRVRNERSVEATLSWKVDVDGLELGDLDTAALEEVDPDDFDEDDTAALEAYARSQGMNVDADDLERLEGKRIELNGTTLDLGKRTIDLEELAEEKGVDLEDAEFDLDKLYGTVTVPKGGVESFRAVALSKDSAVELYYDGKRIESVSVDTAACRESTMADKIDLEAVCHRTRTRNDGNGAGDGDTGGVEKTTEAKFCVHNHGKEDVTLGWTVNGDEQGGECHVDAKGSDSFWVTVLDDRKTSVTVTYDGEAVDTEKADTDAECTDDHGDA